VKVLLRNTQPLLGDRLAFTPAVRDLKRNFPDWQIGVISAGPEVWLNNPNLDPDVTLSTADHIFDIGPGEATRGSKTNGLHIMQGFGDKLQRLLFEAELIDKPLKSGPIRADLYLTDAEKERRLVDGRYWVINTDTGPFTAKRWPAERFQQLVESLPTMTFVQVGLGKDNRHRLTGDNVIDLIDRRRFSKTLRHDRRRPRAGHVRALPVAQIYRYRRGPILLQDRRLLAQRPRCLRGSRRRLRPLHALDSRPNSRGGDPELLRRRRAGRAGGPGPGSPPAALADYRKRQMSRRRRAIRLRDRENVRRKGLARRAGDAQRLGVDRLLVGSARRRQANATRHE
jgi:hypothetical protein